MKLLIAFALLFTVQARAEKSLVIHAAELGVAKFHRMDNKVHPYGTSHAWLPYILPNGLGNQTPQIFTNADNSVTIVYSHLEELLQTIASVAQQQQAKVTVLNVHAHGMPGGMWFARDAAELSSYACSSWKNTVYADDSSSYNQYYSPVSKSDIMMIRSMSQKAGKYGCVTNADDWGKIIARNPSAKAVMSDALQVHFLSCVVGLGAAGEEFTTKIGALLGGAGSSVQASIKFGLGDWSMPEGMGFWDYLTDDQLDHDNQIYPVDKNDREIMQKGTIRLAVPQKGQWVGGVTSEVNFMFLDARVPSTQMQYFTPMHEDMDETVVLPEVVRIPGTNALVERVY